MDSCPEAGTGIRKLKYQMFSSSVEAIVQKVHTGRESKIAFSLLVLSFMTFLKSRVVLRGHTKTTQRISENRV